MQDLLPFCYSSWQSQYPTITPQAIVVDLTSEFVDFLQAGSIIVGSKSRALPQRGKPTEIVVEGVDYDPEDNYSSEADSNDAEGGSSSTDATGDSPEQQPWAERFPQLHVEIESAIEQLGGQVAPKLNWSSPTDALWISSYNSLKCCNADQVILLLKSSDRIMHDLELSTAAQQQQQPAANAEFQKKNQQQQPPEQQQHDVVQQSAACQACPQSAAAPPVLAPQLVLRQWHDLLPEREFRCFVCQHKLVAISQRDVSQHFPQLSMSGELDTIKKRITAFHRQHIKDSFYVDSYALDVYVLPGSPVKILDFNPICDTTSPLLFSWDELPYTHMHCVHHPHERLDHQQRQHQDQEQQAEQQQSQGRQQQQHAEYCDDDVELRIVCDAGMILPGARAATGMPLDMLGLQYSFEEVLRAMKHQQRQEEETH